jgi:hypothetical protein
MRFSSSFKYSVCCSVLALSAFLGAPHTAHSATISLTPESDWSVSRVGGAVPYCTVARKYNHNIVLSFAENANHNLAIGFDFQTNKLDPHAVYDVAVETETGAAASFNVHPIGPTAFILGLEDDSVLRNQLWATSNLKISIGDDLYTVGTQGFREGRDLLQSCLSSFDINGTSSSSSSGASDQTSPVQSVSVGKRVIGTKEVTDKTGNKVTIVVPESMKGVLENAEVGMVNSITALSENGVDVSDNVDNIIEQDIDTDIQEEPVAEEFVEEDTEAPVVPEDLGPVEPEVTDVPVTTDEPEDTSVVESNEQPEIEQEAAPSLEVTQTEDAAETSTEQDTGEEAVDITADVYKNAPEQTEDFQALEEDLFGEGVNDVSDTMEPAPEVEKKPLPTQQAGDENSSMKLHIPPSSSDSNSPDIGDMDDMGGESIPSGEVEPMPRDENRSMLEEMKSKNSSQSNRIEEFETLGHDDVTIRDLQKRAEDLIRENDELKQALSTKLANNVAPQAGGAGMSPQEIQAIESEIAFLKSENERLNTSLKELSLMSGDKMDMQAALRRQLVDLGDTLEKVASDKAALEIELASIKASAEADVDGGNPDLQRMAMEGKYQEAQREIRRLAMLMEEQQMKFDQEKKKLENMLFDPAVTEEHQRAYVAKLEKELEIANQALAEQRAMYESKASVKTAAASVSVVEPQAGAAASGVTVARQADDAHVFDLKEILVKGHADKVTSYQDALVVLEETYPDFKIRESSPSLAKWSVSNGQIWGGVSKVATPEGFEVVVERTLADVRNECRRDISVEPSLLKAGKTGSLYVYDISCGDVSGGLIFHADQAGEMTMIALESSQVAKLDLFVQKDALVGSLIARMNQAKTEQSL